MLRPLCKPRSCITTLQLPPFQNASSVKYASGNKCFENCKDWSEKTISLAGACISGRNGRINKNSKNIRNGRNGKRFKKLFFYKKKIKEEKTSLQSQSKTSQFREILNKKTDWLINNKFSNPRGKLKRKTNQQIKRFLKQQQRGKEPTVQINEKPLNSVKV